MTDALQPLEAAPRPSTRRLPRAVVFDCDGTIADTESLANRAWTDRLAHHGYEPSAADFDAVIGHPFAQNWEHFSSRVALGDPATFRDGLRDRFQHLLDTELSFYPDAVATMTALAEASVPIAVASSSHHAHVDQVLRRAGLRHFVRAIVGADDVTEHKPLPAPYLAAAEALGVDPLECAAIEDTPVGLASALAAGMFTVGIVRAHGSVQMLAGAHVVVDQLTVSALMSDDVDEDADDDGIRGWS